ncbi:T9SS type A sorting domain-containing protein [Dyadobacter sp. BHUBP1]|uniref:T9SS type A sorting domain-containing protein n=1 Tax=Dyadobacter sp. BHUBP1 TaxID=3424178 RepID=UPI003D328518
MKTFTFVIGILLSAIASYAVAPTGGDGNAPSGIRTSDNPPTVNAEPFSVCIEAENSNGTGPITEDPNASNGKTRGAQDNWDHYVDYEVFGAPAGRYALTIRYYAEGDAWTWLSINGAETAPVVGLPATNSWNIVWGERTIDVTLTEGYSKIRIGGLPSHSPARQDRICLVRTGDTGQPVSCDYKIRPFSVEIHPIYTPGQTMNLSAKCTGGDCGATTFAWSGNGIALNGETISTAAPMAVGDYFYSVTASKPGCPDTTATMQIRVQNTPVECDYIVGTVVSDYTPSCGQGMWAIADCNGFGCVGLDYKWSGPGLDISGPGESSVNFYAPSQNGTYTYTRTTSKPGCPDNVTEFKLIITDCGDGPFKVCLEAEDAGGTGPVTTDPNASGGKTRGGQDRQDYSVYYLVHDVQVDGPHAITFRYYAEANTAIEVQLNSEPYPYKIELPASNSWNIVWKEHTLVFGLRKGLNIIILKGLPGYSPVRHDRMCIEQLPGTGVSCDFNVTANASTTSPQCGSWFTLSGDCTGPDCGSIFYNWHGPDGFGRYTQNIDVQAPSANGIYTYTLVAGREGCVSKNIPVDIMVNSCPTSGGSTYACVEAENAMSNGATSSDPNASNGQTRGSQNDYNYYVDYQLDNFAAGTYPVTLRYYAEATAKVSVSVNGGVILPEVQLPPTNSWNIVSREETFWVTLVPGQNTIRIQGLSGPAVRQDKICVGNVQSNARMAAPEFISTPTDLTLLQAYPNPAPGEFKASFHLKMGEAATIRVTDVQGKVWHTRSVSGKGSHEERIKLDHAPAGIYLLQVKKPDSVETKKILLTR